MNSNLCNVIVIFYPDGQKQCVSDVFFVYTCCQSRGNSSWKMMPDILLSGNEKKGYSFKIPKCCLGVWRDTRLGNSHACSWANVVAHLGQVPHFINVALQIEAMRMYLWSITVFHQCICVSVQCALYLVVVQLLVFCQPGNEGCHVCNTGNHFIHNFIEITTIV